MKTLEILHQTENRKNEETPKKTVAGIAAKFLFFIFVLSWITILPSCAVAVRTPHTVSTGVVVEHNDRGGRHNRSEHNNDRHKR